MVKKKEIQEIIVKDDNLMECLEFMLQDDTVRKSIVRHKGIIVEDTKVEMRKYLVRYEPSGKLLKPDTDEDNLTICSGSVIITLDIERNTIVDVVAHAVSNGHIAVLASARDEGWMPE